MTAQERIENLAAVVAGEADELAGMLPTNDSELASALRAVAAKLDQRFSLVTIGCP